MRTFSRAQRRPPGTAHDPSPRDPVVATARPRAVNAVSAGAAAASRFAHDFSAVPIGVGARSLFRPAAEGSPSPLPHRAEMEHRFGEDFSAVRAYLGRQAPLDRLNAHAATLGDQVAFAGHAPDRRRVAHELAHVVQQRRGGGMRAPSPLSIPGDAAERDARQVADRVAAGAPAGVSAAAAAAVHRDIKDNKMEVPLGKFAIDMTKVEVVGGLTGETGTLSFTPNEKAPDSKSIRLSQAARSFDVAKAAEKDWTGTRNEKLNLMRTTGADRTHVTRSGETLKAISERHYGDPARFTEIYQANQAALTPTMAAADGDKALPEKLALTVPKAVLGGYLLDHFPSDPRAKVRKARTDPEVPQDYVWPGEEIDKKNQHGSKSGKAIVPAIIKDSPQTGGHVKDTFETVARSADTGIYYGTVHWGFEADSPSGKVSNETHSVTPGVSDTFRAALQEFTRFYKNPHTVMKGDTLFSLARQYYGDEAKWKEIFEANKALLKSPDSLQPGMKLAIPVIGP